MTQERWSVNAIEAEHLAGLWRQFSQAERELKLAFTILAAGKGLREVVLLGVEGREVLVGIPDPVPPLEL